MNETVIVMFARCILTPDIRPEQLIQLIGSFLPFLECSGFGQSIEQSVARLLLGDPTVGFLLRR